MARNKAQKVPSQATRGCRLGKDSVATLRTLGGRQRKMSSRADLTLRLQLGVQLEDHSGLALPSSRLRRSHQSIETIRTGAFVHKHAGVIVSSRTHTAEA